MLKGLTKRWYITFWNLVWCMVDCETCYFNNQHPTSLARRVKHGLSLFYMERHEPTILYNDLQYYTMLYTNLHGCMWNYKIIRNYTPHMCALHKNALQRYTMLYNTLQCSTMFYNVLQCSTMTYNALQCSTMFYNALHCSTLKDHWFLKDYDIACHTCGYIHVCAHSST